MGSFRTSDAVAAESDQEAKAVAPSRVTGAGMRRRQERDLLDARQQIRRVGAVASLALGYPQELLDDEAAETVADKDERRLAKSARSGAATSTLVARSGRCMARPRQRDTAAS